MKQTPPSSFAATARRLSPAGARTCGLAVLAVALAGAPVVRGAAMPPGGASGDYVDLSLEQLMDLKIERVYGASRHDQKVTQAPSSVSIVTAGEIQQFGWRTLADLLRSVRGFYTFDDRNYGYLGQRGFLRPGDFNTRVLILIDGHRMTDNIYDGGYVGREQISMDLLERVEVIRGPSSSVYGSSAFFGVINLVTKHGGKSGAEISTDFGDRRTFEGRVTFNHQFANGVEWMLSGTHYASEGEDRLYFPEFDPRISDNPAAANDGVAVDSDGERAAQVFSSLRYRDFTISGFVSRRAKEVPTASYGTVFQRGEWTGDRRGYLDVKFDRTMGDHRLLARAFYDQYRYDGYYPYEFAAPGDPSDVRTGVDGAIGEWIGTELQFNARLSPRHTVIVGAEYRENTQEKQFAYFEPDPPLVFDSRSRNLGVFAQWDATLRKDLTLTAGVRHDYYHNSFGGTTNPRLGLIYNVGEGAAIKLLYGQAFRAPNPYESHYYDQQRSRPPLSPERISTRELVFERYWGRTYRATLALYDYDVKKLITQQAVTPFDLYFENVDNTHARGGEVEFEARYDSGWLARASFTCQRSEDQASGEELTFSPRRLAKLNVGWAPRGGRYTAGVEAQYQSSARTLAGAKADGFTIVNLHLLRRRWVGFDVAVTATNLFDKHYGLPGSADLAQDVVPQDRRRLFLKLTRRF